MAPVHVYQSPSTSLTMPPLHAHASSPDPLDPDSEKIFRDLLNLRLDDSTITPPTTSLACQQLVAPNDPSLDLAAHLTQLSFLHSQHDPNLDPAPYPHQSLLHSNANLLYNPSLVDPPTSSSSPLSRHHSLHSHPPRIKNDLYKTEICRSFAENAGYCKYGAKCQFAHGEHELRPVRRHPRYKTKTCRNFANTGSCPYDTRCRFIHFNDSPFVPTSSFPDASTISASTTSTLPTAPPVTLSHHSRFQSDPKPTPSYAHQIENLISLTHKPNEQDPPLPADRVYHPTASVFDQYSSPFMQPFASKGFLVDQYSPEPTSRTPLPTRSRLPVFQNMPDPDAQ